MGNRQGILDNKVALLCPKDRGPLASQAQDLLQCDFGHAYPVVDGIPVLLRDDVAQTLHVAEASLARCKQGNATVDLRAPMLFLESLGVGEPEKQRAIELALDPQTLIDPVVQVLVAATCGNAYKKSAGRLTSYPIPDLQLPSGAGRLLLDVGCSWGRWSIAAAQKGYRVVGIDPSLGAVMAAKRVTRELGLNVDYIVCDARYLPFADGAVDVVLSYYVLQHLSKQDALGVLRQVGRVLKSGGQALIQMPNASGLRTIQTQLGRMGVRPAGFEVRYWSVAQLRRSFEKLIGPCSLSAHCYFGLQLEASDRRLLPRPLAWLVSLSEGIRRLSVGLPPLVYLADSFDVRAVKVAAAGA